MLQPVVHLGDSGVPQGLRLIEESMFVVLPVVVLHQEDEEDEDGFVGDFDALVSIVLAAVYQVSEDGTEGVAGLQSCLPG